MLTLVRRLIQICLIHLHRLSHLLGKSRVVNTFHQSMTILLPNKTENLMQHSRVRAKSVHDDHFSANGWMTSVQALCTVRFIRYFDFALV